MREKIGKALKTRAEAIRNALEAYNECAKALKPPRPTLVWHDIMEMASLAEFDLLRDAREDIREYPWAKRLHRQAMNLHFNVKRAREEIQRLDVEIPRLFTALVDRHFELQKAMASVRDSDPALAYELQLRWLYEDRISARITARLYQTAQLKGFSGRLAAGKRVGRVAEGFEGIQLPTWASTAPASGGTGGSTVGARDQGAAVSSSRSDDHAEDGEADDVEQVDSGIPGIDSEGDTLKLVDFIDGLS